MIGTISGIEDYIISTEEIREYTGASFEVISNLYTPNTRHKMFTVVQELLRQHISHNIINLIINGVRNATDPANVIAKQREENTRLRDELAMRDQTNADLENKAQDGAQGADAIGKADPREEKSMAKISAAILFMAGKDLHSQNTRAGIKRFLDAKGMHMDDKTAKKHFDMIQGVMDKFPKNPPE